MYKEMVRAPAQALHPGVGDLEPATEALWAEAAAVSCGENCICSLHGEQHSPSHYCPHG